MKRLWVLFPAALVLSILSLPLLGCGGSPAMPDVALAAQFRPPSLAQAAPANLTPAGTWISPFVQDGQSPNEYSFLSILNTGSTSDTVTVSFYSKAGTKITDDYRILAAGEAWQLFTGSAGGVAGTTGMDGWLKIEGLGTSLVPFGAIVLPNAGNFPMVPMTFYTP